MNNTHKFRLLEALKRGETLTAHDAFLKYGVATFSQRIGEIESMGYTVFRSWVHGANGTKFMRYWIPADQVAA